jgi:hypothetical protein
MKSKSAVPLLLLLVVGAIFGYSGCTAIGFGIGAITDSYKPDYDTIPGWRAGSIKRGNDITLTKEEWGRAEGRVSRTGHGCCFSVCSVVQ